MSTLGIILTVVIVMWIMDTLVGLYFWKQAKKWKKIAKEQENKKKLEKNITRDISISMIGSLCKKFTKNQETSKTVMDKFHNQMNDIKESDILDISMIYEIFFDVLKSELGETSVPSDFAPGDRFGSQADLEQGADKIENLDEIKETINSGPDHNVDLSVSEPAAIIELPAMSISVDEIKDSNDSSSSDCSSDCGSCD